MGHNLIADDPILLDEIIEKALALGQNSLTAPMTCVRLLTVNIRMLSVRMRRFFCTVVAVSTACFPT